MIERGFVRVCLAGGLALGVSACNARDDVDTATLVSAMTARTVGLAYLEDDRYLEAATELTRLIDLLPREAIGYANLALARFRTGDVAGARESMERAVSIEPDDADIRYNLAVMLEGANLVNEADATLRNNVAAAPDHVMSLYALARLGRTAGSVPSAEVLQLLGDIVARRPGNLMARLELIDALLATGDAASAVAHVEFVAQLVPDLPPEVGPLYRETLQLVRGGEAPAAQGPATAVHNLLRSTPLYQAGVERLVGRPGLPGIAIQHFRQALLDRMATEELVHANVRFAVSRTLALNIPPGSGWDAGMVDASDFDGDGDADILVTLRGADGSPGSVVLLDNRGDSIVDVTRTIPIMRGTAVTSAKFTDYDDDGNVDVIVTLTDGVRLYRNNGNVFTDVTTRSGLAGAPGSNASISGDFDHDGDLDLYFARNGPNRFYRNDGSGVFEDRTGATGLAGAGRSTQLALGDFDNDLDLDLLVGNADGGLELFANLRQGRFHDVASDAGIASEGVQSFTVNDMTNDGSLDMLRLGSGGAELLVNAGDGTFGVDTTARSLFASFDPRVAQFLDFDNDGQLDIAIRSAAGGLGLLRNEGQGRLSDATASLPRLAAAAVVMGVADFDADGDIDIVVVTTDGMVSVLRNDGGNTNNYLQVQLAGLGRGSNKNNHYGIGARLEVTAGESYQSRVVTDQVTHIGLGRHATADAVRITWTNGVPQTAVRVAGNQLVVEDQILKGSCAFLYAWNGEEYVFVTDMMWKSALGMPLGIMQSEMAYAPPDASREYLLIPGSQLQPHDGEYALQITEELWEVAYLDRLELVVYDHPDSIDLFVDEKFVPPFVTDVGIYHVSERHSPVSASDQNGVDVLARIAAHDFDYVSNLVAGEYQGITEMHDLVLGLGDFGAGREVRLFLTGWIFPTDASINVAVSQTDDLAVTFPYLQVRDAAGEWQTVIDNISFPQGKNKTMVVDLTGRFLSDSREVRIRTNMEIYWDYIFYSLGTPDVGITQTRLQPTSADLHYRGFSRLYRRGGRYGPHWFEYSNVTTDGPWVPIVGTYTRYGDILPLLAEPDDMYVVFGAGDEISLRFDANRVPELPEGWSRDFLIYSDGFLKDADLNTYSGRTVGPLPFHAMTEYPYGGDQGYPGDSAHVEYLNNYHTREVGR